MLRIIRIALFVLVPTVAVASLAAGGGDDTSPPPPPADIAVPVVHDMAVVHDMVSHD